MDDGCLMDEGVSEGWVHRWMNEAVMCECVDE